MPQSQSLEQSETSQQKSKKPFW